MKKNFKTKFEQILRSRITWIIYGLILITIFSIAFLSHGEEIFRYIFVTLMYSYGAPLGILGILNPDYVDSLTDSKFGMWSVIILVWLFVLYFLISIKRFRKENLYKLAIIIFILGILMFAGCSRYLINLD